MATQESVKAFLVGHFSALEVIFKNSNKELGHGTTQQIVTELRSLNAVYSCLHIHGSHFNEPPLRSNIGSTSYVLL